MNIKIQAKSVYGNDLLYPADDNAALFCKLTRKKTLDIDDLLTIRKLGYHIDISGYCDPALVAAVA